MVRRRGRDGRAVRAVSEERPALPQRRRAARELCANCGGVENVRLLSFDLDLPAVRLCGLCSLTIVADQEMFEAMGKRKKKKT